jgi:hypothetical protein
MNKPRVFETKNPVRVLRSKTIMNKPVEQSGGKRL